MSGPVVLTVWVIDTARCTGTHSLIMKPFRFDLVQHFHFPGNLHFSFFRLVSDKYVQHIWFFNGSIHVCFTQPWIFSPSFAILTVKILSRLWFRLKLVKEWSLKYPKKLFIISFSSSNNQFSEFRISISPI